MSFSAMTVAEFLAATAMKSPTPGGGAVASVVGALGASLAQMVVSYSIGKKNLAEHQETLGLAAAELERARRVLLTLADEDAQAYGLVNELSRLDEGDPRRHELAAAQAASVQIPLAVAATSVDLLRLFVRLGTCTNRFLRSDLAIAAVLAEACVTASGWNVRINLPTLADGPRAETAAQLATLERDATTLRARVLEVCQG